MNILYVGLGGGLGAILRYFISLIPYKGNFPLLTLLTNIFGAIVIGYIAGTAAKRGLSENLTLFLKTGVCGGFTTFSTFSLEAYTLLEKSEYISAFLYIILSIVFCLAGILLGMYAAEHI